MRGQKRPFSPKEGCFERWLPAQWPTFPRLVLEKVGSDRGFRPLEMWCPAMCGSGSESSRVRSSNIIRSAGTECRVHLDSVSRCRQALQGRRAERIAAGFGLAGRRPHVLLAPISDATIGRISNGRKSRCPPFFSRTERTMAGHPQPARAPIASSTNLPTGRFCRARGAKRALADYI